MAELARLFTPISEHNLSPAQTAGVQKTLQKGNQAHPTDIVRGMPYLYRNCGFFMVICRKVWTV